MNSLDIAIIVLIFASALTSVFQGFVREMLSVLAWLVALLVMLMHWATFDQWLDIVLPVSVARMIIAGLALFLSTLLLTTLINTLVIESMQDRPISAFEGIFGILFGLARGGLFVVLFCTLAGLTQLPQTPIWQTSVLLPVFIQVSDILHHQLAPDVAIQF